MLYWSERDRHARRAGIAAAEKEVIQAAAIDLDQIAADSLKRHVRREPRRRCRPRSRRLLPPPSTHRSPQPAQLRQRMISTRLYAYRFPQELRKPNKNLGTLPGKGRRHNRPGKAALFGVRAA